MTTLLPTSQSTGVEAYEDMFKEITRKLYGDEATAHGLYPHNTQVAQLAPGAPSAPPDGGERSFTTLTQIGYDAATGTGQQQQQQQQQPQQQHPQQQSSQVASGDAFKAGEHISTAFGLAALMQGGFPPPGTILNPVNFPPGTSKTPTNISGPSGEDRWAGHHQQQASADEQGSWHAGKHSASPATSSYRGKSYKKPKTERHDGGSPVTAGGLNIPSTADRSKGNNGGGASGGYSATGASTSTVAAAATGSTGGGVTPIKRYTCSSCPYTTDRRDLFTRHENIHKEEKPFQCYACLKPFNRADHVKKHFLRMHRELEYDIAKTRRYPPGTSSSSTSSSSSSASASVSAGSSGTKSGAYYSSAANGSGAGGGGTHASTVTSTSSAAASSSLAAMPLNIPSTGSYTSGGGGGGLSSHVLDHHAMLNSGHSSHLLQLQQAHHQHQQQQQQQQHHSVQTSPHALQSISVKQEKTTTLLNTSGSSVGSLGEDKSFPKKVKGEKKFSCAFCPWAGTDNWGLKRHLNTHTKPYVCLLCDYKAARSERLATHVFKVHNRKACGKCNFIADDQSQLDAHLHEAHLLHMQAVGRNKASVTQDFHNAGGGDYNGINGHASPPSSSPSAKAATMDRKNGANTEGSDGGSVKIPATSSLASLLGGDQLSFLQLLATAAVAQQHLQLQSGQHNKKQHQQHQQPHLIQPKQPSMTNGSYSSPMASSPPATSTPHQHQHNSSSSSSISNNAHSTNGGTLVAAQPLPLVKRRRTTNNELSNDKENLLYRKTTMASGVIVNNSSLIANGVTIAATASLPTITNGRNGVKNGHHHHHHHHNNNNNNNSSTNNKNINDIFDKVYKKPQSTFAKQQPILRTAPPSAIEEDGTGPPPPPVATDYTDPANQYGTEKFSLAEFLKNHTEVSISTVGGAAVTNTGKEDGKANRTAPPLSSPSIDDVEEEGHDSSCSGSSSSSSSFTSSSRKRKADNGERNPRKQQQPRRIDGFEVRVEPVAVKTEPSPSITPPPAPEPQVAPRAMLKVLSPAEVVSKLEERKERDHAVQRLSESEEEQKKKVEAEKSSTKVEKAKNHDSKPADEANTQESPSKLADIRDKHMIQLVTRRLCCRICQHKGALEHLDNCHYHSKISLLLHTRWRHQQQRGSPIRCRQCDNQFPRLYKLILHQKLTGHKGTIDKSVNDGGTEPDAINSEDQGHGVLPKKQRKRKPRSQCFTRRRK
ncbi:protein charlatan isoform X2 [Anopheles aquasalis]|uniref:protein charlatan isoform X2 n=1 Tax=Anopheles aquasalis TaxID=42839 RepID=UPI00215B2650|nr:protein charlatan isoform X2 [Anopheles aquasalis]